MTRGPHKAISWFLYRKVAGHRGVARCIQSPEREKMQLGYSTQQDYHLEQREKKEYLRRARTERTEQY